MTYHQDEPKPKTAAGDWFSLAKRAEQNGEFFRAFDLAAKGLAEHPDDWLLKHLGVLCLSRAGATDQARRRFVEFGLPAHTDKLEVGALRARLLKDQGLQCGGPERRALLLEAAQAYEAVHRQAEATGDPDAYYPAINAATLQLLAGEERKAAELAARVVNDLTREGRAQAASYFEIATLMEAHLLLRDGPSAEALVPAARAANGSDGAGLATTARHLRLIARETGLDAPWLLAFAPARIVFYTGHMIAPVGRSGRFAAEAEGRVRDDIAAALDRAPVAAGYGALASGADILFAEALLARGASLHLVLPFRLDDFVEISVRPAGEAWIDRFRASLGAATTLRYANEGAYDGDPELFGYSSRLAMGLALLHARQLGAPVEQLAVWDGRGGAAQRAGTSVDVGRWRRAGLPETIIGTDSFQAAHPQAEAHAAPGQRVEAAMLFADVKGFSRLDDAEVLRFVKGVLAPLAAVVDAHQAHLVFSNTWGDGLFLALNDVGAAAGCALALHAAMDRIDRRALGLPDWLGLRIGGHVGPVRVERDPVLKRANCFGAHVTRAARIEPVTPIGCAYVTESFAAALALDGHDGFACDYVGTTSAAKGYGSMRMFLLNHRPMRPAEA
jgi:hypothetical protein